MLKALACLEFCGGAGKCSKLANDAKVESSLVDEAYCGCSEAKWKVGGCPLESLVVAREKPGIEEI